MTKLDQIKEQLNDVPMEPGVYLWKDKEGTVIYVGKAKRLRARMRQYVNFEDDRAKIPMLVSQIDSFAYVVVNNEHESLVLEKNLINQYEPFFNADFKDDKSYPFIALTKGDAFPAIKYTREHHKKDTEYIGPFTDSRAARDMVDIARRIVPICASTCAEWRQTNRLLKKNGITGYEVRNDPAKRTEIDHLLRNRRRCFDCHVGLGPGACCAQISPEDYAKNVKRVERFLKGQHQEFIEELSDEMQQAASQLDFERAERIKERIKTINSLNEKQHAVSSRDVNADVIGFYREETIAGVQVLIVREGRIINGNEFVLNKGKDVPDQDLFHNFMLRYYDTTSSIPHEIICEEIPEDKEAMEEWLTEKLASVHGAHVRFTAPERGDKLALLRMAQVNAQHTLVRYKVRNNYEDKRTNEALLQIESALAMDRPPMRIECFDISTIHGNYTVASMVVFTNGRPDKSQYRRFKIHAQLDEANDFVSMAEVMKRRYSPERMADTRFGHKPDLIILDGGKPQLTAALEMFDEMGVHDIAIAGLAKRDEELFVPWQDSGPVILPSGSPSLYLVKQVRDEAHRFAITFHRELRGKGMTTSILDEVEGIGPKRKKALLKSFHSFKRLREASVDDIKASHTVPDNVAQELYDVLQLYNDQRKKADSLAVTDGVTGKI